MDTVCANVEVIEPVKLSVAKIERMVRAVLVHFFIVLVRDSREAVCSYRLMGLVPQSPSLDYLLSPIVRFGRSADPREDFAQMTER